MEFISWPSLGSYVIKLFVEGLHQYQSIPPDPLSLTLMITLLEAPPGTPDVLMADCLRLT